jgi:adenylosuccinate synthase
MKSRKNLVILTADLGFGDAGKGSVVDFLTRACGANTVVRYNGGAQAAHNVITPDGRHHTFAQFGSGTFLPGVRTHLSRYMLLHPIAMLAEERNLRKLGIQGAFSRVSIERAALVTTPYHQAVNRLKEIARGDARHGSCGMGIGETMADWLTYGSDMLFAGDLVDRPTLVKKLRFIREAKIAQMESLQPQILECETAVEERRLIEDPGSVDLTADIYDAFARQIKMVDTGYLGKLLKQPGCTIFEGAQGVLLDEWFGFYPYNSWSTCTLKNADTLLDEAGYMDQVYRLGIIRGYMTRHGAGPLVTEDAQLTTAVQDRHNLDNPWQRQFRVGHLDLLALRYALQATGRVDGLAVTNLDRMAEIREWQICDHYLYRGRAVDLATHFEIQGEHVVSIKTPLEPTDLLNQEKLTHRLLDMLPGYTQQRREVEPYLAQISQALDVPVVLTSTGPTAQEKQVLAPFLEEIPHQH